MTVTELHPVTTDDGRDPRTEAWLNSLHVEWTFDPALALTAVDVAASLANQARLEALDDEVVDRYAADMERGDRFPPLLVQRRARRKPVILGGNHRAAGARKTGVAALAAYLVECEPEMALRLMYEDNRRHGLPPAEEERIAQAVHLIVNQGYTLGAAAEVVGVSESKISRNIGTIKADQRARDLGLDVAAFVKLPKTSRWRLGSIHSDPVFTAAAKLVTAAGFDTTEVYDLATRVNEARSDAAGLKVLDALAEQHRERIQAGAGGKAHAMTAKGRLSGAITAIDIVNPEEVARACATEDQRVVLARRVQAAIGRLELTVKALHNASKKGR